MPDSGKPPQRPNRANGKTHEERRSGSPPIWLRLSGSGLELAFTTIVFAVAGFGIDHWLQNVRPMGSAFGGLIGFTLGMIRFIRLATSISAEQRRIETDKTHRDS